jgi:hypothetical protein
MQDSQKDFCMKKCGREEVTGILLNDPEWLKKEQFYMKCKRCREKRAKQPAINRKKFSLKLFTEQL